MFKTVKLVELFDSLDSNSSLLNKNISERFQLGYEVYTKDDKYYVKVLLPDIKKENISLKLEKGNVLLSALRIAPEESVLHSNIVYGELYSKIPLSRFLDADVKDCSAEFKEGVLLITLNKKINTKTNIDIN